MRKTDKTRTDREAFGVWSIVLLIAAAGIFVTFQFVEPPPPKTIILATGSEQGAYHAYGKQYRESLAESGIDVELRNTAGSIENLDLLDRGEVDLAFVQGGTTPEALKKRLRGLASLYYEPLWIFLRKGFEPVELSELAGRRIQVGKEGSGTRAVALELLAANGIEAGDAELFDLATADGVARLREGALDALFIVASGRSNTIQELMAMEGSQVGLLDMARAPTYERLQRHLRTVTVTEGLFDLARNLPDREIRLLSPTAQLMGAEDLHHALVPLLIETAGTIHGPGDLFERPEEFPSASQLDVPLDDHARHYFRAGRSFLYRILPFRVAAALDRLKILLLPLLTLLLPLLKIAPPIYRWRIRSKIYRWYKVLREVEGQARIDAKERAASLEQLRTMQKEIDAVEVPPSYMEELYNMRMHLERVRRALTSKAEK